MKTRISSRVALSAAIVMGWSWLTALQCGDPTNPVVIQDCPINKDTNFPTGASFSLSKPQEAKCPIAVPDSPYDVPYAAHGDFPAFSVYYAWYENELVNMNGATGSFYAFPTWGQGDGRYFVDISGDYPAATAGFDANHAGWDDIRNTFLDQYGQRTSATAHITYMWGPPRNTIQSPGAVDSYQPYSVSAITNDPMLTSPTTWSLYVDGELWGTSSSAQFTVYAGDPGTQQHLQMDATDQSGHTVSGTRSVLASCNGGRTC
jgi:hypothetical protein